MGSTKTMNYGWWVIFELSLKTNDLQKKLFDLKTLQLNLFKVSEINPNDIELSIQEVFATEKVQEEHCRLVQISMFEAQKLLNEPSTII